MILSLGAPLVICADSQPRRLIQFSTNGLVNRKYDDTELIDFYLQTVASKNELIIQKNVNDIIGMIFKYILIIYIIAYILM